MTAENPAVADAYLKAQGLIEEHGGLSDAEQQAVLLAISRYNDCHYCTDAHAAAGRQAGLDAETVEALNTGALPDNERLRRLVRVHSCRCRGTTTAGPPLLSRIVPIRPK